MFSDIVCLGVEIMATNNIQKYEILNTILPYFKVTKYPYDHITDDKIIETQKEIDLVYQYNDNFFTDMPKKGGSYKKISIYLCDYFI